MDWEAIAATVAALLFFLAVAIWAHSEESREIYRAWRHEQGEDE